MRKDYILAAAGLLLLLLVWRLHGHAQALVAQASPFVPTRENYPNGYNPFTQPRASLRSETPEERRAMELAYRAQWMAAAALVPAVILLIKSGIPLTLAFLAWLLIPEAMRERMHTASPESPPTEEETPCDSAAP